MLERYEEVTPHSSTSEKGRILIIPGRFSKQHNPGAPLFLSLLPFLTLLLFLLLLFPLACYQPHVPFLHVWQGFGGRKTEKVGPT